MAFINFEHKNDHQPARQINPSGEMDPLNIKRDFPILFKPVRNHQLVYLDNAATTQKPHSVIKALYSFYTSKNANIHRGVHFLSEQSTLEYESAREKVRHYINASDAKEIVFTRGATEAINLVAQTFGRVSVQKGDEIIVSELEHHSNIVPWQMLCEQNQATLRIIPINDKGELLTEELGKLLNKRTKLLAISHVSNAIGTINPIKEIIQKAHQVGVPVLIDGAQATAHLRVDVQDLDCDFYTFSGHKMYAPTGIGALYAKKEFLESMPPYQGGGDMITRVSFKSQTRYNQIPHKFEAGTPNISGAIGLGAAIDYLSQLDMHQITAHENELLEYATTKLQQIPELTVVGTAAEKTGIISFVLDDIHPHDIGTILDQSGIAIRAGHHCAMPLMERFGINATTRASFGIYNTLKDVDRLVDGLKEVTRLFKPN
jgi:cysteine desulfurase / selenocysteine lyase